jgi:1-acyl-sn-glycerol-3-phosphate acyltransferase
MQVKEKSSVLFLTGRQMFRVMFSLFYRLHIEGTENIPQSGGAVIAPNHIGFFDSTLAGSAVKRPVHFMAKKELFDIPVFGWIIKRTNAFPVKRGMQDIAAVRNALSLLKNGRLLLIFPEGKRSEDGRIGKARAGAGMIACNAQVPLIPAKIENTNMMLKFKQIKIKFGEPVYPPKDFVKNDYISISKRVLDIISGM